MLDGKSFALLKIINGECPDNSYKVFGINELALSVPEEFSVDAEAAREIIKSLAAREYLSVKYEDEAEVCLKPLSKGRLAFETRIDEEVEKLRSEKRYFLWSFLGAAAGGGFIVFVTLIVALISGASC